MLLCARLWRQLGLAGAIELQLNSLGNGAARREYRQALVTYLEAHVDALDEDSRRRLHSNPLRILDSKVAQTQQVLDAAPVMADYLDDESRADFARLCELLQAAGVRYTVNSRLVRGLDYYNKTVYEWVTTRLGAQGTVCGGGRYDNLVEQLGGRRRRRWVCHGYGTAGAVDARGRRGGYQRAGAGGCLHAVAAGRVRSVRRWPAVEALRDRLGELAIVQHTGGGSFRASSSGPTRVAPGWP